MTVAIPDPSLYDIERWSTDVREAGFSEVPFFATEERWTEWADYLSSTAVGLQYGLPASGGYSNWRDWATRVYQVMT